MIKLKALISEGILSNEEIEQKLNIYLNNIQYITFLNKNLNPPVDIIYAILDRYEGSRADF